MRKLLKPTLTLALMLLVPAFASAETKKYDLKSGVVTYGMTLSIGGKPVKKDKVVVSFDDYGMKERRDTYEGDKVKESFLSDGKDLILLSHEEKKAYKRGAATRGTELRYDWNEVSEKDKKEGKAKKGDAMTVAGKKCESYVYEDKRSSMKVAGTGGLLLFTESTAGKMKTLVEATKVEENAKVSPDLFKIPAGYAVE